MGGYGSGTWRIAKLTIEESMRLDIRLLRKQGSLASGMSGNLSWERNGKPSGSIGYRVYDESIILNYSSTPHGSSGSIDIRQSIKFDETHCHYGGLRRWFLCPHCASRREILYLYGNYFTCRKCADLAYQCQHEQPHERNNRQALKIQEKLKPDNNKKNNTILFKPKGMHQATFDKLREKQFNYVDSSLFEASDRMLSLLAKTAKLI